MVGIARVLQRMVVCVGLLLLAHGGASTAWADQCGSCGRLSECGCTPNVANFGYFPTQWRVWPGEERPDLNFPHSIGTEQIRTPRRAPLREDSSAPIIDEPVPEAATEVPLPAEDSPIAEPSFDEPMPTIPEPPLPPTEQPAEDGPPMMPPPPAEPMPEETGRLPLEVRAPDLSPPLGSSVDFRLPQNRPTPPLDVAYPPRPETSQLSRPSGRLPLRADPPLLARPNMSGPARVDVVAMNNPYVPDGFTRPPAGPDSVANNASPIPAGFAPEGRRSWGESASEAPAGQSWVERPAAPMPSQRSQALSSAMLQRNRVPQAEGGFDMALPQPWSQPRDWRQTDEPAVGTATVNQQAAFYNPSQPAPEAPLVPEAGRGSGFPPQPAEHVAYQHPAQPPAQPFAEPDFASVSPADMGPALGGYCPVELVETQLWASGDARWTCVHRGRLYRLSGPAQRSRFTANPDRYAPVLAGTDPVLALEENTTAAGKTQFCVDYDGRLYTFASAATMARFHRNPVRYAGFVSQAGR